jgi:diadenosine tetraphosphate (Ap4A) HIT family hydrolase
VLSVAKKIALATGAKDWNFLQNNGRLAHQMVDHVHFHVIPKPDEEKGLVVGWPADEADKEELKKLAEELKSKM